MISVRSIPDRRLARLGVQNRRLMPAAAGMPSWLSGDVRAVSAIEDVSRFCLRRCILRADRCQRRRQEHHREDPYHLVAAEMRRETGDAPRLLRPTRAHGVTVVCFRPGSTICPSRRFGLCVKPALAVMDPTPLADHMEQGFSGGTIDRPEIAQSMLYRPRPRSATNRPSGGIRMPAGRTWAS